MKTDDLNRPLGSTEREDLGQFLASTPSAMTPDGAEGFLAGIATAPTWIAPSEWLPMLLGEHVFESIQEAERTSGLTMRLFNEVLMGLREGRADRPSSALDEDQIRAWCGGYLEASRVDPVWWGDDNGHVALLPFAVLAGEFSLVGEESVDGTIIEDPSDHIRQYRRELPDAVVDLYEYWTVWRHGGGRAPGQVVSMRIGRNDPCPCGSGRKYKRCCGGDSVPSD